jgi:hypothetical protein
MNDLLDDVLSDLIEWGSLCHVRCGCGCGFCFDAQGMCECPLCKAVWAHCDCGRVFKVERMALEAQAQVQVEPGAFQCRECELGVSPKRRRA